MISRGQVQCRAPAKVNLTFRVVGRRSDGYHLVESVMAAISLYDRLSIRVEAARSPRIRCEVSGPERVSAGPDNLVVRAADRVLDALGVAALVSIRLLKEVPSGAGLGGGSSDAAAVLRQLPGLLGRRLPAGLRHEIAVGLGADVPFFLDCRPAVATGIGDILTPAPDLPDCSLVVVVPETRVDTRWAYANALPRRLTSSPDESSVRRFASGVTPLRDGLFNDFERGVGRAVADIGRLSVALRAAGAEATVMSGSGSAVFGLFADRRTAERAAATFAAPDRAFAVRLLRRAPRVDVRQ